MSHSMLVSEQNYIARHPLHQIIQRLEEIREILRIEYLDEDIVNKHVSQVTQIAKLVKRYCLACLVFKPAPGSVESYVIKRVLQLGFQCLLAMDLHQLKAKHPGLFSKRTLDLENNHEGEDDDDENEDDRIHHYSLPTPPTSSDSYRGDYQPTRGVSPKSIMSPPSNQSPISETHRSELEKEEVDDNGLKDSLDYNAQYEYNMDTGNTNHQNKKDGKASETLLLIDNSPQHNNCIEITSSSGNVCAYFPIEEKREPLSFRLERTLNLRNDCQEDVAEDDHDEDNNNDDDDDNGEVRDGGKYDSDAFVAVTSKNKGKSKDEDYYEQEDDDSGDSDYKEGIVRYNRGVGSYKGIKKTKRSIMLNMKSRRGTGRKGRGGKTSSFSTVKKDMMSILTSTSDLKKSRPNYSSSITKVLKKWLCEHSHDPYPSERDKVILHEQTGLSILQINNWFINGRRRYLTGGSYRKRRY